MSLYCYKNLRFRVPYNSRVKSKNFQNVFVADNNVAIPTDGLVFFWFHKITSDLSPHWSEIIIDCKF